MQISWQLNGRESVVRGLRIGRRIVRKSLGIGLGSLLLALWLGGVAMAQGGPLVLQRDGRVISLVPYAPNIVRVTISTDAAAGTSDPGYGFVGKPSAEGWTHERDAEGDVFRSARMVVRVSPENLPNDKLPKPMPLDALNQSVARHLLRRRRWSWSAQRLAPGDNGRRQDTAAHAQLDHGARTSGSGPVGRWRKRLSGCGCVRLACRRALLRIRAAAEGLDGPA